MHEHLALHSVLAQISTCLQIYPQILGDQIRQTYSIFISVILDLAWEQ